MMNDEQNKFKLGRVMYILEAALEYLISILVAGSFLATLTKELEFSDSLTGILSSIISLGCLFQLISLTVRRSSVKRLVIFLSIVNQVLFMLLYVVPLVPIGKPAKTVIFVVLILSAYISYNFAHPKKINWLMSLVDDTKRGRFTANKEIISLLAGMAFSFGMGSLIDSFTLKGETRTAFILSTVVIFVLMVLHSLSMIFTPEACREETKSFSLWQSISEVFKTKSVLKVTAMFVIYYIANYSSHPFYGSYQINELGFSLKFVSVLSILSSLVRIAVSGMWGRYADKKSFAVMIEKCLAVMVLANICVVFAVPSNGKVMFILYYIFHGIAMGGINSALINMVFDYVPYEKRSDSLAVSQASAGLTGFITTLAVSPIVSHIQKNGNTVFGIQMYAQQAITVISLFFFIAAIIYVRTVLIKNEER